MSAIVVLGEHPRVDGFVLARARVVAAEGPDEVRAAWDGLPPDAVVVLTPAAAAALRGVPAPARRLRVVMPA
ncbi:MAG: hypothetical protein IPM45_15860 [Acidimicrobiales bacterium]|nr:hypothetical protein [Acidimicrobiales bacterium]